MRYRTRFILMVFAALWIELIFLPAPAVLVDMELVSIAGTGAQGNGSSNSAAISSGRLLLLTPIPTTWRPGIQTDSWTSSCTTGRPETRCAYPFPAMARREMGIPAIRPSRDMENILSSIRQRATSCTMIPTRITTSGDSDSILEYIGYS